MTKKIKIAVFEKELERSDESTKELSNFAIDQSKHFIRRYYSKEALEESRKGYE